MNMHAQTCPCGCGHIIKRFGQVCGGGNVYTEARFGELGFNVLDGDMTVGLGGGLVEDLGTGQVELQVAPGVDIPLGGGFNDPYASGQYYN